MMFADIAILYTWNFHNVINQYYSNFKKLRHENLILLKNQQE